MKCLLTALLFMATVPLLGDATITAIWPEAKPVPANPLGAGYMLNWFETSITDALNDASVGQQLGTALHRLNATGLRFPGGAFTYFYPTREAGLKAFKTAGFAEESYNLWEPDRWGWASEQAFFEFCGRNDITAWYEINPAYVYDVERDAIGQFAELPRRQAKRKTLLEPERYLPLALKQAGERARLAAVCGAKPVWEIGNEDYVYFEPEGYAHIAAAFIKALRQHDPAARVAVCGDSESWSTREWQTRMIVALKAAGVTRVDYSSVHLYLAGVGEWGEDGVWRRLPMATIEDVHASTIRAYQLIRAMYADYRTILTDAGYAGTRLALTETNPFPPNSLPEAMRAYEHCLGRTLAEATNYPFVIQDFAAVFFHDLCRSGPGTGDYFRRIRYDPAAKPRYSLPLEAQIMGRVSRHAAGQLLHHDWKGVCASAHGWGLYLTATNPERLEQSITLKLANAPTFRRRGTEQIMCSGLDAVDEHYELTQVTGPGLHAGELTVRLPPFSFTAVSLEK